MLEHENQAIKTKYEMALGLYNFRKDKQ